MSQNKFINYLNSILKQAKNNPNRRDFNKYRKFYNGKHAPTIAQERDGTRIAGREAYQYNIVKGIVETKATISLDNQITTQVKPSSLSHANFSSLKEIESISEILNDVWESIKKSTNMQDLHQRIVRDGLIYGIGVAKAHWDRTAADGLGDVRCTRIAPLDFFPEPHATSVENANYIFVRRNVSKFDLINQYKGNKKIINIISKLGTAPSKKDEETNDGRNADLLLNFTNTEKSGQAYAVEGTFANASENTNIEIWECYLKDDTVFIKTPNDSDDDEQVKKKEIFKYPNGRLIIYSGNYILEDGPIDYPFGFPFSVFNPIQSDNMIGMGDVADLIPTQNSLIDAYYKLNTLLTKYKSFLIASPESIPKGTLEKNFDIVYARPGAVTPPTLVTNKLTQDIEIVRRHINDLKQDALKIARINEIMLSGERPVGTSSGQMIKDLVESPMSSIREIQRNFKKFLVDLSDKGIILIQLYYNQPRILRLSGDRFAAFNVNDDNSISIDLVQKADDNTLNVVETIQNDLSLSSFEVEVQTGSSLPQSQAALAATTLQLARDGLFGNIQNPDVVELILKTLDYPHYRAVVDKIKQDQKIASESIPAPNFENYLKKITISLSDIMELVSSLDPNSQYTAIDNIATALGILPEQPIEPEPVIQDDIIEDDSINLDFSTN